MQNLIKIQEIISLLATIFAMFLLGEQGINPHPYIYAFVGAVLSIFMYRVVFDRLKLGRFSAMVAIMSLPFVASWIVIAPTALNWYIEITSKSDTSAIYKTISVKKEKVESLQGQLLSLKAKDKNPFLNASIRQIREMRNEWKLSNRKRSTKYNYYIRKYGASNLGSGETAIITIANYLYLEHKDSISAKRDTILRDIRALKGQITALKASLGSNIPLSTFFVIMGIVGVLIEVLITHIDYWFEPRADYIRLSETMDLDLVKDTKLFLSTVGAVKGNWELNAILAMFRSSAVHNNTSLKNASKFSSMRKKNGQLYKINTNYYRLRKELLRKGVNFQQGVTANLEIIKDYI